MVFFYPFFIKKEHPGNNGKACEAGGADTTLKNGHAEHIHANCDCEYAVRFDGKSSVEGYDPEKYLRIYDSMSGTSSEDKINSLRRMLNGKNPLTLDQIDFIIELEYDSKILDRDLSKNGKNSLITKRNSI